MPSWRGLFFELLHDQVVVLGGVDEVAVVAQRVTARRDIASRGSAATHENVLQPASMTSSLNASRVPEVGGGPSTSMLSAGRLEFTSDHFV